MQLNRWLLRKRVLPTPPPAAQPYIKSDARMGEVAHWVGPDAAAWSRANPIRQAYE